MNIVIQSAALRRNVKRTMSSKNRVTVNLSDDEYVAFGELAERSKVKKAWLGRYAISALLQRAQNDEQQLPLPLTGFKPPKGVGRRGSQ